MIRCISRVSSSIQRGMEIQHEEETTSRRSWTLTLSFPSFPATDLVPGTRRALWCGWRNEVSTILNMMPRRSKPHRLRQLVYRFKRWHFYGLMPRHTQGSNWNVFCPVLLDSACLNISHFRVVEFCSRRRESSCGRDNKALVAKRAMSNHVRCTLLICWCSAFQIIR